MNNTTIGVDLAKDVIQACVFSQNKVISNSEMNVADFTIWLAQRKPTTIIFEACGTSNYWKQKATSLGHTVKLISAKLVNVVRQQQKNDKNDALAIVQASHLPDVKFIEGKTLEQQQLQSLMRIRELAVKQKTAIKNQIKALLLELNIRVSTKNGGLSGTIQYVLENAENGYATYFRQAISAVWKTYLQLCQSVTKYDKALERAIRISPQCKKLIQLEGVGPINAINLYLAIGCSDSMVFKQGKDVSACIGLTPVQHSSGGKTKLGTISKKIRNQMLRSQLVTGAFTFVNSLARKEPKTEKERWLKSLIDRKGKKCASVALANKTVRTAFSMITKNTEYKVTPV